MLINADSYGKWHQINYRNVVSVLGAQFIFDLYDQYAGELNVFRYRNACVYYENDTVFSYTLEEDWKYINEMICSRMLHLDEELEKTIRYYVEREKTSLMKLWKYIDDTDITQLSNEELGELLYRWYYTTLNDIFRLNLAPVEHGITEAIHKKLEELGSEDIAKELPILLSFSQRTSAVQQEYDMLQMVKKHHDINENDEEFLQHYKEYRSLACAYGNLPWSMEHFVHQLNKVKSLSADEIDCRIHEIEEYPSGIEQKRKETLELYHNDLLNKLSDFGCNIGALRDRNKAMLGKSIIYRNRIIDEICNRCGVEEKELRFYFLNEIVDFVVKHKKVSADEIERRERGILLQSSITNMADNYAREFKEKNFDQLDALSADSLKGVCASPGSIRGKVVICRTSKECEKVNSGDILVTYGTDFDYIEAMSRAGAIITEEGGMLSHASVISRELNKPCIIGMKNVMKVLKDNEVVQVNADQGVVVVLKVSEASKVDIMKKKIYGVYSLQNIKEDSYIKVGGKAYNLANVKWHGYNVKDAIVFSVDFFYSTLQRNGLEEKFRLAENELHKTGDPKSVLEIINCIDLDYDELEKMFDPSKSYAVRSSGIAEDGESCSFAGQHYTGLFCNGWDSIKRTMLKCWESFYSESAIAYRKKKNVGMGNMVGAVIVQEMLGSEFSGVMFTKNPVTNEHSIVIEVCKGQCYKLVDGTVTPSRYYIAFNSGEVVLKQIEFETSISEEILEKLKMIAYGLEKLYGNSVDVEWGYAEGKVYILQVRPITT